MIGENRQLGTNEPVDVQDFRKIIDHFRGIYRTYPTLLRENRRMSTCKQLDLQTLRSQLTKVETRYHDNDLILTPIISSQSG